MSVVYNFPAAARFGKIVSKSKIYEHTRPSTKVKTLFAQEIKKITWAYKLSPKTINIPATKIIDEIQVFHVTLKLDSLSNEVLATIDKAIPSPIIFIAECNGKTQYIATYKRPNDADSSKWVISSYFKSPKHTEKDQFNATELPLSLNMESLYEQLLKELIPLDCREDESLQLLAERVDKCNALEREIAKLKSRLKKEKQFNRKVEINSEIRTLSAELDKIR